MPMTKKAVLKVLQGSDYGTLTSYLLSNGTDMRLFMNYLSEVMI